MCCTYAWKPSWPLGLKYGQSGLSSLSLAGWLHAITDRPGNVIHPSYTHLALIPLPWYSILWHMLKQHLHIVDRWSMMPCNAACRSTYSYQSTIDRITGTTQGPRSPMRPRGHGRILGKGASCLMVLSAVMRICDVSIPLGLESSCCSLAFSGDNPSKHVSVAQSMTAVNGTKRPSGAQPSSCYRDVLLSFGT